MTENRSLSSSEQYIKKSNRKLLIIGLVLLVLFFIALMFLSNGTTEQATRQPTDFRTDDFDKTAAGTQDASLLPFGGNATLTPEPAEVNMTNVVLGSKAESIIVLTAQNGPILFLGMELAEAQQDGFTLETTCTPNGRIDTGASCNVKVLWNPVELRQIQNILYVRWREDSTAVYREERTSIPLRAQSTDSKDCVICENVTAEPKEPRMAMGFDGKLYEIDKDGYITIDGQRYRVTENGIMVDEAGNIIGVSEPEYLPLGLDHRILGTVSDTKDVISPTGDKVGRLLGDGTIVTSDLKVVGAALPIVSVMNAGGQVIGKLMPDGTVVDGTNTVIGRPLVDGNIVNLEGAPIGSLRPWGLAIDFTGNILGAILPDGNITNTERQNVARITPTGLAIDPTGELIGGVIPRGVAVGAGCASVGNVLLNGQVKDSYEQIVGQVQVDGSVLNTDMVEIGTVMPQSLVINEKGTILGFVNSMGKAVDAKGSVIGCINPDGSISAGKKLIGAVMAKGYVIGNNCLVVGSVYPDGNVFSDAGEGVGRALADKYVTNANNRIVGVVVPKGTAVSEGCRLLGLISLRGRVLDTTGVEMGCVTPENTVINAQRAVIGSVATRGTVVDASGNVLGRMRLDGKVVDKTGRVIGCINPDGTITDMDGKMLGSLISGSDTSGVILDENGNATGWSTVGTKVYDATGNEIGSLLSNRQVVNMDGNLIGYMPPNGVVFSNDGLVLGRYSQSTGVAVNMAGERFARILPDYTAISGDKGEIVGALIPDQTTFMGVIDGTYLGTMQMDGVLADSTGTVIGAIRADGTVADRNGRVIGIKIPQGTVYSSTGSYVGTVSARGEVLSSAKTPIGRILGNNLAISNDGAVLGAVYNDTALAISPSGMLGSIGLNGAVNDKNGRRIGTLSPFGLIIGTNGELMGNAVRVGPFVDWAGNTVGWMSFKGDLNGKDGRVLGSVLSNGVALDRDGHILGVQAPHAVAVNTIGAFAGSVAPNARVIAADNTVIGSIKAAPYYYNTDGQIAGQYLKPGVALDPSGNLIGWTRYDGVVTNATQVIGLVSLDGRVFAENGAVLGFYVPLGMPAVNDSGKTFGFMAANGTIVNAKGDSIGKPISTSLVMNNGKVVGRLLGQSDFVKDLTNGTVLGQAAPNGTIFGLNDERPIGNLTMNGVALNLTSQIIGGLSGVGVPLSNSLATLGQALFDGTVVTDSRTIASSLANSVLMGIVDQTVAGGLFTPDAFIGRDGRIIGANEGGAAVLSIDGSPIANQMPYGSALTTSNVWAGGVMPSGVVVTDDGYEIGAVAADGAVLGASDGVMGRILPDGSAVGVLDRNTYTSTPYIGAVTRQGLAVHYKGNIIGRTTLIGDVVDAAGKKLHRVLDDGSILGTNEPLTGVVVPFNMAINHNSDVIGALNGEGVVVSAAGEALGTIATNGTVKGSTALNIVGGLIPSGLVTNGCSVVGQSAYNGQIINGKGDVVGRILIDKTAVNRSGEKIGRVTRLGGAISTNGDFLGRSLPDATVVDTRGTNIGCVAVNGDIVDTNGTKMGCILERGPVIGPNGTIIARSKFDGTLVNAAGAVIGKMGGDCKTAHDMEGNVIGRMASQDEELMYNPDGTIAGTFDPAGVYRDLAGNEIFRVAPGGLILDPKTNRQIGLVDDSGLIKTMKGENLENITVLTDLDGNILGILSGCSILNVDGDKIASIMSDGSIMDLNGDLYASVTGDGILYDKSGTEMGRISGTNTRLDRCGIKSTTGTSGGPAGRRIFIGNKAYNVSTTGSIMDSEGTIIGYMGDDGRPYSMDNRLLTGVDSTGRTRPNLNKRTPVSAAQVEQMMASLQSRREQMRSGIKKGSVIKPDGRIQARARKKEDADWGVGKIVSSWPVKMTNMILKDKAIPAVLVRSIDSRYKDVPATAIVERHIYSEEGRNIIIPAGSRLIGKISGSPGQNHVAKMELKWERLIRPDGGAFSFAGTSGDAQGRGGVAAYLDEQLLAKYGKPIMSSTITSAITYLAANNDPVTTTEGGTRTQSDRSKAAEDARETFRDNMDQIFQQLIDDATSIPPVVFVPAGTRLTVFSNEDLWLRSENDDEEEYDKSFGKQPTSAQNAKTSSWVDKRNNPNEQITNGGAGEYYNPGDAYVNSGEVGMDGEEVIGPDDAVYDGSEEEVISSSGDTGTQNTQTVPSDLSNRVSKPVLPKSTTSSSMF